MANEAERTATGGTGDVKRIDPVAIALALGRGGDLDPRAAAYLENQARVAVAQERVLQLQAEDLQRENKLHHWSLIVRHISDVLKVAFELAVSTLPLRSSSPLVRPSGWRRMTTDLSSSRSPCRPRWRRTGSRARPSPMPCSTS